MPGKVTTAKAILQVVGWLKIAAAVTLLCIFFLGAFWIGLRGDAKNLLGSALLGSLGVCIAAVSAAWGVLDLAVSRGISQKKTWARTVGMILGILWLPGIPIGTILGVFILVGLLGDEANAWFG